MKLFKMKRGDYIAIILVLAVMHMMCLWTIDISISAMTVQPECKSTLTNGWRETNPMLAYHFGLYGCVLTMVLLSFFCIRFILGEVKCPQ